MTTRSNSLDLKTVLLRLGQLGLFLLLVMLVAIQVLPWKFYLVDAADGELSEEEAARIEAQRSAAPPEDERAVYEDDTGFTIEMGLGPYTWMSRMPRPRRSFAEYLRDAPPLINETENTIYLMPLGDLDDERLPDLETLAEYCSIYYGVDVEVLPTPEETNITGRIHSETQETQLNAAQIKDLAERERPEDAFGVMVVTPIDIWPGDSMNFVFSTTDFDRGVGVVSLYRPTHDLSGYEEASDDEIAHIVKRRAFRRVAHEVGHLFHLTHCAYYACGMSGSYNMKESDGQPLHACPVCLRKLKHATDFDALARYARLEAFYDAHGLKDEATWMRARRDAVTPK